MYMPSMKTPIKYWMIIVASSKALTSIADNSATGCEFPAGGWRESCIQSNLTSYLPEDPMLDGSDFCQLDALCVTPNGEGATKSSVAWMQRDNPTVENHQGQLHDTSLYSADKAKSEKEKQALCEDSHPIGSFKDTCDKVNPVEPHTSTDYLLRFHLFCKSMWQCMGMDGDHEETNIVYSVQDKPASLENCNALFVNEDGIRRCVNRDDIERVSNDEGRSVVRP